MEMCQKQTQCPFLKNGCFSVNLHLISGSIFHPIFLKNEIKNEIKNGSKMRTVNTPIVRMLTVVGHLSHPGRNKPVPIFLQNLLSILILDSLMKKKLGDFHFPALEDHQSNLIL